MDTKAKKLTKNIGIFTLSGFGSKILILLLVPLYTSVLSTEEYGQYELLVTTVNLVFPLITLEITSGVMRFLMNGATEKREAVGAIGLRVLILSCIIFATLLLLNYLLNLFSFIRGYEFVVFIFYLAMAFYTYFGEIAKGLQKVKIIGVAGIISTSSIISFNILFLLVLKWGLIGFFVANILGFVVPSLFYICLKEIRIAVGIRYIFKSDRELVKEMILYSMPLVLTAISWTINNSLDKYMVTYMIGLSASGLISIAYKVPNILAAVQNFFNSAWQISAIDESGQKDTREFYDKSFNFYLSISAVCCSVLIIFSKILGTLLYSGEFKEAWIYVPFLLLSSFFNSASGFMGPILVARMDSKKMALSGVIGIITNVLFNYLFILWIGIQGAAIATSLSSFSIFLVRYISVRDSFSTKTRMKFYMLSAIAVAQSSVMIFAYGNIRAIALYGTLVLLLMGILFICRKEICGFARTALSLVKKRTNNNE